MPWPDWLRHYGCQPKKRAAISPSRL